MQATSGKGIWGLVGRLAVLRLGIGGGLLTLAISAIGLVSPLVFTRV